MTDLKKSEEVQIARYGYHNLMAVPDEMSPWNLRRNPRKCPLGGPGGGWQISHRNR